MPVYISLLIRSLYKYPGTYCTFLLHKTSTNEISSCMSNCCRLACYNHMFQMEIKGGTMKMGKLYRLINLLLIFLPLVTLALMAGLFGLILFEFRYWEATLFNE